MMKTSCDQEGRIYLEKPIRAKYGEHFIVLEAPGELVLVPVPEDPVKDLEEWGKPLQHLSLGQIKGLIEKRAREEVGQ